MRRFLLSASPSCAHWVGSLMLQHLSGYICAARHRCWPYYILLHSILIVHLLPTQSNDEVSEVFVRVRGVEDDPLYYSLERWTVLLAESASDGSSYTASAFVLDILKSLWFLLPILFPHKPRELYGIVHLNTSSDFLSTCIQSNFLSAPPFFTSFVIGISNNSIPVNLRHVTSPIKFNIFIYFTMPHCLFQ